MPHPHPFLVLYLISYAALHSLLASQPCKRWVQRICGTFCMRWYRLAYNIVAVITLIPFLPLLAFLPDHTLYVVPAPWRWLLLVVQGAAALGFLFALRQTSMRHFLGIAGESPLQSAEEEPLVTDGAYAYVRHPLYAFGLLWMWCSPVLTVNLLTVNIIFSLYLYIGSWHEEQRLAQQFGAAYRDYQQRVGRFIPRFPRRSSHSRTTAIE